MHVIEVLAAVFGAAAVVYEYVSEYFNCPYASFIIKVTWIFVAGFSEETTNKPSVIVADPAETFA